MSSLILAFASSFVATFLIIHYKNLHQHYSADWDLAGPQKFHTNAVPRIGGISIAIGLFIGLIFRIKGFNAPLIEMTLLACVIPTFLIGLSEDLSKKISVKLRLLFTAISATLLVYFLPIQIVRLDIYFLDIFLLSPIFGAALTIFAITGLANAYNIIDGFNGLSSMVGIITLLSIAYVSFMVGDMQILYLSLLMTTSIFGFFVWNYPRGLIFLGDGGAYLIGFWIASLSILLVYRHTQVSPWFALLISGYPIVETLFTIYRRKIHQGKSAGQPDGIHFHTLIYRRILRSQNHQGLFSANARTAPYIWMLTIVGVTPALLWWKSTSLLMVCCLIFLACYIWLYNRVVNFKTPWWMHPKP